MADVTRDCPTGCGRSVGVGHLMCATCWRLVPKHLQVAVWRSWRAYRRDSSDEHFEAYDQARTDAIGAIS